MTRPYLDLSAWMTLIGSAMVAGCWLVDLLFFDTINAADLGTTWGSLGDSDGDAHRPASEGLRDATVIAATAAQVKPARVAVDGGAQSAAMFSVLTRGSALPASSVVEGHVFVIRGLRRIQLRREVPSK